MRCTWWGHASATVAAGGARVAVDPLLVDRLAHLGRYAASPGPAATEADLVLVSHQHLDHCHVPSLARFAPDVPLVVPRGSEPVLSRLADRPLVPVAPGDVVERAGVRVEVLAASHDGRRHPLDRAGAPALGFRVTHLGTGDRWWYPGDTGLRDDMVDLGPVDLALVPIGGWGPSLGEGHMGPDDAAEAVRRVGARWAVGVHWGTFWPLGLRRLARRTHRELFVTPGERFVTAMAGSGTEAIVVRPGETVDR
ncbi:MBL fold metallo-hydrolase [Nocardioides sp. YIM 123512]|uniref:MBL fold metallo-hydrolase n=1 Tax=Nocardioides flavescens TaxID=2691959 RepID=A0A6L7EZ68_9ACTN|nr:MBL fold metallo-hydrolase [Nocardioides flavescens]MXG89785.1 MBL fold metallo-hydrolase [Nocardioides flavescens]